MNTKPFGRTQKIAIGALLGPGAVASAAMFLGLMTAAEWSSFMQWLVPSVTVPLFGFGAGMAIKGPSQPSPTPAGE